MKRQDILMETMNTLFYNRSLSSVKFNFKSFRGLGWKTEYNPGLVLFDPAGFVPF